MSTHNVCFEQKYKNYQSFLSENLQVFLEMKFSVYLNRHVFLMRMGANFFAFIADAFSEGRQNKFDTYNK